MFDRRFWDALGLAILASGFGVLALVVILVSGGF